MEYKEKVYRDAAASAASGNVDSACKNIASLLGLRSEVNRLMAFLVDTYLCEGLWDRSVFTNETIASCYTKIVMMPKRQLLKNDGFRTAFAQLVACTLSPKASFLDKDKYKAVHMETARLERKLESVLLCREAFAECSLVTKLFRGRMTAETAHLFDALYHFMKRKDKRMSTLLVAFMCNQKSITFDRVPNNSELFDDIKEDCKVDLAWYVWWFLIGLCKRFVKEGDDDEHWFYAQELVNTCFNVYKLGYVKKSRSLRVGLLQCVVLVMLAKNKVDIRGSVDAGCVAVFKRALFGDMEDVAVPSVPSTHVPQHVKQVNRESHRDMTFDSVGALNEHHVKKGGELNDTTKEGQKKKETLRYFDYVIYNDDDAE